LDCDDWWLYGDCEYSECHDSCNVLNDCYFVGEIEFSENCVDLSYACSRLVNVCADYSDEECVNDACGVGPSGCELDAGSCVEAVVETCSDGIQNQDEKGVDCGGICITGSESLCNDGIDNDNDCLSDCADLDCSLDPNCIFVCGDGNCDAGEDCPADAGDCVDNICYEPTCMNGCGQDLVGINGNDEACLLPNFCDGVGSCVECIVDGDCVLPKICVGGSCQIISENTFYVSQLDSNCDDNGLGTSSVPWCSLSRAYTWYVGVGDKVQEGDIVIVRDGSYGGFREDTHDGEFYLIYRNDWVTYKADEGHMPTLDTISIQNLDKWGEESTRVNGDSYLIFDGFRILNGVSATQTSYVKIMNCNITRQPNSILGFYEPYFTSGTVAINLQETNYVTIQGNEISNSYRGMACGRGSNLIIKDNVLHHFSEDGLSAPSIENLTIENNYFYDLNKFTTSMTIKGVKTGDFIVGETVVLEGTDAVGIVRNNDLNPNVYATTENTFWHYCGLVKCPGKTLRGQTSGATMTSITDADASHCDCFQLDGSSTNVLINNNTLDRIKDSGNDYPYGQGFKLAKATSNVTFINNLVIADTSIIEGTNLSFQNNTFFTIEPRDYSYNVTMSLKNNLIYRLSIIDEPGTILQITNHSNNIYGNNPHGFGVDYPFVVDWNTELVDYDITSLFADPNNFDYRVLIDSPACDGSVNGLAEVAVGALPCVCIEDSDCIFGGNCIDGECIGDKNCFETDLSCGVFPSCINCDFLDGCFGSEYRDYSCTSNIIGCEPIIDDCSDCSCICESYGESESLEMENCADGIDNDCDGDTDSLDFGCQVPILLEGYTAYYRFENNILDYTGNNTGIFYGDEEVYVQREGINSNAIEFNGDDRISPPNSEDLDLISEFTISVWVNSSSTTSIESIFQKGAINYDGSGPQYSQYGLWMSSSGGNIRFNLEISNSTDYSKVTTNDYAKNTWYHIVARFNATSISIFVDGELVSSTNTNLQTLESPLGSYDQVIIGVDSRDGHTRYSLHGRLDDLLIYKKALSETEIQEIYCEQGGSAEFCSETETCLQSNNCFYVSVTGAGNNNGSLGNEMDLSDAQAYANLNTDVEIEFRLGGGRYVGGIDISNAWNERSEWAMFKAKAGENPVLDKIHISNSVPINSYISFVDLIIEIPITWYTENGYSTTMPNDFPEPLVAPSVYNLTEDIVITNNINHLKIINSTIKGIHKDLTMYPVFIKNADNILFSNNEVLDTHRGVDFMNCRNASVSFNHISHLGAGSGIFVGMVDIDNWDSEGYFVVEGNHIHNQTHSEFDYYYPYDFHGGTGISIRRNNVDIINNVIHDGFGQGVMTYFADDEDVPNAYYNLTMVGNVIYNTRQKMLKLQSVDCFYDGNVGRILVENNTLAGFVTQEMDFGSSSDALARYGGNVFSATPVTNHNMSETIFEGVGLDEAIFVPETRSEHINFSVMVEIINETGTTGGAPHQMFNWSVDLHDGNGFVYMAKGRTISLEPLDYPDYTFYGAISFENRTGYTVGDKWYANYTFHQANTSNLIVRRNIIVDRYGLPDFDDASLSGYEEDYNIYWKYQYFTGPTTYEYRNYTGVGDNSKILMWYDGGYRGYPMFFENLTAFDSTARYTPEFPIGSEFKPFFISPAFYTKDIDWNSETNYSGGQIVKYEPNGLYYESLQDNNIGNPPDSSPLWWEEHISVTYKDQERGKDADFHPLINSPVCNGGYYHGEQILNNAVIGTAWAGALPCVCTTDLQCEEVFGVGNTCDVDGECVSGMGSSSALSIIWNWFKGFLTGNTIKEITGRFVWVR